VMTTRPYAVSQEDRRSTGPMDSLARAELNKLIQAMAAQLTPIAQGYMSIGSLVCFPWVQTKRGLFPTPAACHLHESG